MYKNFKIAGWFIVICIVGSSCAGSKTYLERSDEDRALQDAVKKLNKSPDDEKASAAVPILYNNTRKNHLAKIKELNTSKELSRWDKILSEYDLLQDAYDAIINSPTSFKLVTPQSFSSEWFEAKQSASEDYYQNGLAMLSKGGRANLKTGFNYFNKADKISPGFKNAKAKATEAYEAAIVNVLINPVQDNSFFYNNGWGNTGNNFSNQYFLQTLVKELNSINKSRYPSQFYSEWEARRDNIKMDWVVDLTLRNINIPYPTSYNYTRNASDRVQVSTDTSGNPVYKTVYATLYVTRSSFTARADMDVNITDMASGKSVSFRNFREDYRWEEERASYNGDSRALSARDWDIINRSGYSDPRREDVLDELFRRLYPQIKNNIIYAVEW